ncbi:P-loop containing nucleoside triphosphate hydrolase protein [Terfezia claveryi]|nr:P-loop containing nucleoside triphosphate hydrolase protein [Terfezia claveryi]
MHREDPGRHHHRRRSSNGQTFLNPGAFSASHSRQTSEESVFLPAEDIPRPRRNSLREREQNTGYAAQQSYVPITRGGVTIHQTAHRLAEVTGALGSGRGLRSEGPPPVVWIAVMGVTGSGKSTFIQTATGDRSVGVNHGLRSCTREVEVHSVRIDGFQVNLIDTPGFDDNKRSETEVLQTISTYLAKASTNQVLLNGIIYVHSIMQTRMGGSGIRSLGILERLTGCHNLDNILLVSNMWDALKGTVNNDGQYLTGQQVGELREHELQMNPEFWKGLIDQGAHTSRHCGGSWESAHELIRRFLYPEANKGVGRPMKLLLQVELVDQHKRLEETEVGNYINKRLYEGQQKLEKEIVELRRRHQRALDRYGACSSASPSDIGSQLEEKKKGLNDVRKNSEILGKRADQLISDHGNKVATPHGRTSGAHAGLCNVM